MARRPVEFAPRALADLDNTIQVTEKQWSARQAERYGASFDATFLRLSSYPELGVARPEFDGARSIHVERHLVIDQVGPEGVLIPRIVHQKVRLSDIELI